MRRLLLLIAVLAVTGCDSALGAADAFSATLATDGDAYATGAEALLIVENRGTVPIEFGPPSCYAMLETEPSGDGDWTETDRPDRPACASVVVVLPPGETAESPITLGVDPGTYRLLLDVSDGDEDVRLATDPFEIL